MTYIPDNTVCRYFPFSPPDNLLAIGWLDKEHPFPQGPVDKDFFLKLCDLIRHPWQPIACMGFHGCELCQFSGGGDANIDGKQIPGRSAANLFIPYEGTIFVAPELIAHYIDAHHYQPPKKFIEAVMACPPMNSMDFKKKLLENGGKELLKALATQPTAIEHSHSAQNPEPQGERGHAMARLIDGAMGEYRQSGKVVMTKCDKCNGLLQIEEIGSDAWQVNCPCGRFKSSRVRPAIATPVV